MDKRSRRFVAGLSWFIAIQLFLFGPAKLLPVGLFGYPSYPDKFVGWGYPPWFSFVIGSCEILAGVMLIRPRQRFLGAAIMLFILPGPSRLTSLVTTRCPTASPRRSF